MPKEEAHLEGIREYNQETNDDQNNILREEREGGGYIKLLVIGGVLIILGTHFIFISQTNNSPSWMSSARL